jgi:spore maturation protein CgeB
MKIIYSGLKYANFNPKLGLSFEHINFYESLHKMPDVKIIYFPYERILELGRERGNAELLELIKKEKPDLFFAFMFTDELVIRTLEQIKQLTTSLAWFSDDHWRFDNYSKYYAPHFSWVITTYSKAIEKYHKIGVKNIIRSQWAANTDIYQSTSWADKEKTPEVSFVGTWSRPRERIISFLQKAGINIATYGSGWSASRINQQKMIEIFSNSKINLVLNPAPGYFNKNSLGRLFFKRSMDKIVPDFHFLNNFKSWIHRNIPQIKARHFEIPACGGFAISSLADDIKNYFEPDKEMVFYKNIDDLAEKIKYYLEHNKERQKIAQAGYQRIIKEHTYKKRFNKIFQEIKGA